MPKKRMVFAFAAIFIITAVVAYYISTKYTVPVIMYHNIDNNSKTSALSVSSESFRRQMGFFYKNGYHVVSLEKLTELIKQKKNLFKTIAITFDDGYENNFLNAYPVLKKYNLPATIFVTINYVGNPGYLTWEQVKQMSDSGIIDIGGHGLTHEYLPHIKDKQKLKNEVFKSKEIIESKINTAVVSFSYPGGGFNKDIISLVKEAGYKVACATNPPKEYPKNDIFVLKRLRISRTSDNLFVFWIETSGFYTWIKEIRDED